ERADHLHTPRACSLVCRPKTSKFRTRIGRLARPGNFTMLLGTRTTICRANGETSMPKQRLATGVELYYESHGEGEALVLIPGTGFAGNVWSPSQVPALSKTLRVIVF